MEICDFCDEPLEEDEELEPVFIGEPPEAKSRIIKGIAPKDFGPHSSARYKGKLMGELAAVYEGLLEHDAVEVETNRLVREVTGEVPVYAPDEVPAPKDIDTPDTQLRDDKCGATIKVEPRTSPYRKPAMRVCPYCASSLRGE